MPEIEASKEKMALSFDKAIEYMEIAHNQVNHAFYEVYKYQHPVAMEIGGTLHQITHKIERLKQLRKDIISA